MTTATSTATGAAPPRAKADSGPKAPGPRGKADEIQGFRGIAALSTVVFHVWQLYYRYDASGSHPPIENKYIGSLISLEVIDFFFVTSGYLLTIAYARAAIDGGSTRPAGDFLFRRVIRIVPLYFLAVLFVWSTRNSSLPGNWLDLLEHLTFTHVFDREQIFFTLGPAWSLSLEVVFYLFLVIAGPLAVRACKHLRARATRIAFCLGACVLLFAAPVAWISYAHWVLEIPHTDWPVYFGPQARFGGFAAGMALAVIMVALGNRGLLRGRTSILLSVLALGGAYWLSFVSKPENLTFTFYHPLTSLMWTVLMYSVVHTAATIRWHALLRVRFLGYAGLVSYSLFMWHEPVMLWMNDSGLLPGSQNLYPLGALIVVVCAFAAAVVSYWVIEYPCSMLAKLRDKSGGKRDFYPELVR
ncbi:MULTISPECIES: acyltransferase family protein [Streptomyces]|uniref:Acyltransferase 3 n=1 Tax=Streptomyces albus (strain ATCC 21838 / DSM 41398 / FERM P-419 / JCM 4703 / NBRC 107858) TaxID=1081613 RepID=A0A0B5EP20_STRA4|nr:acyltransferase [Streptomyces sp. SCSIO ZS0520]AJE81030.1 acyltransferase 3 [Streptomyces albus]AOU75342.1 acyltransferase 3 [Streptomyces albus]AYN31147.1 acyltransferase [Streptomyces albus]